MEDDYLLSLLKKFEPRIRSLVRNLKILNQDLMPDVLQEVRIVFLERINQVNIEKALSLFIEYWTLIGVNRVLRNYFPEENPVRPARIRDFYDKVKRLMKEAGYPEQDAKEFVVLEESFKRRHIFRRVNPVVKDPERDEEYGFSAWLDRYREDFPGITDLDRKAITAAIVFCFENLEKKFSERDVKILEKVIILGEPQIDVSKHYNVTPPRIAQIKTDLIPHLIRCLEEQLPAQ